MGRATVILKDRYTRQTATDWVSKAPSRTVVEFRRSKRSVDQNSRMWSMLTDVARQLKWHGERLEPGEWKLLFMDALGRESGVVPGINGGIVSLGISSSRLTKDEMSDLMEVIAAVGANHGVKFMRTRNPRQKDAGHLHFIRALPCAICLDNTSTEAAHIRYAELKVAKENPGMQQKPDDRFTVPLCGEHHREQHKGSERAFWNGREIDPHFLALALYNVTGDVERGEMIVRAHGHH